MMALAVLGWLCTAGILSSYLMSALHNRPKWFHVANAVTFVPLAVVNAAVGAWWVVLLNVSFGLIACFVLWRER